MDRYKSPRVRVNHPLSAQVALSVTLEASRLQHFGKTLLEARGPAAPGEGCDGEEVGEFAGY